MTGTRSALTYAELRDRVARLAGALAARGVGKGDRVVIYMPMVPEALVGMLACARLGAIHSVVFGGFAAPELAVRIDDARPKAIIAASCGIEPGRVIAYKPLVDAAIEMAAHKPDFCLILQREQAPAELGPRDLEWHAAQDGVAPAPCVPVGGMDPLYILYTSGTTGQPKGVVRATAGYLVALAWTMPNIYRIAAGDVFWSASDVGWVVGHSYIAYGPLLAGATTIVFEGKPVGTPDAGAYWRVIAEHRVKSFFTAPTAFRAIKREDPEGRLIGDYDIASLKPVPRGRAGRSRHRRLGASPPEGAGDRPLVADRDRLGDRREPRRHRAVAGEAGLAHGADAGLRRPDPVGVRHPAAAGRARRGRG